MKTTIKIQSLSFYIIACCFFVACSKDGGGGNTTLPEQVLRNIAYGAQPLQNADVYLPAGRNSNTKVVVILHGGAWSSGDKADIQQAIDSAVRIWPEACIINANYRLATTTANQHPTQMVDIKTLVNFINGKKTEWSISNSIGLTGVSAGAHLAMLYGWAYDSTNLVKALGSIVGPADLTDPYYRSNPLSITTYTTYLGKTWQQDSALYRSASPAFRLAVGSLPVALFYGGNDQLVPTQQYQTLVAQLSIKGVQHEKYFYPNEGHVFTNPVIGDAVRKLVAFLKTKL
jgi:acetyl esterase/lipase